MDKMDEFDKIDRLIRALIKTGFNDADDGMMVNNPHRIEEIKNLYDDLIRNKQQDVLVSVKVNDEVVRDLSYISLTGKTISLTPNIAKEISELADTFEVSPMTNGNIEVNIGFYGTTKKVECSR